MTGPLSTPLTRLTGVAHPVVQTGMGWVAGPRLVTAVAEAGALGILASATMTTGELDTAIRKIKFRTDKPFGVNLRADASDAGDRVTLLIEHGVKVASFALAPRPELIARLREHGVVVMPSVGAAKHARRVASWGADLVMVQGGEGGGHTGPVPTSLLLPQVLDAVDIPVVAAGGYFDGRGLAAALAYGAAGIGMGTRFLLTADSSVPEHVKHRYLEFGWTAPSSPPRPTACHTACCAPSSSRTWKTNDRCTGCAAAPSMHWNSGAHSAPRGASSSPTAYA